MKTTLFSAKNKLSKKQIILIITLVVFVLLATAIVATLFIWNNFSNNSEVNTLMVLQADFDSYGFNVELFLFITLIIALVIVLIGIIVCTVFLIKVAIIRKQKLVVKYDFDNSDSKNSVITISENQGENSNV